MKEVILSSHIASFTQPGFSSNYLMIQTLLMWLSRTLPQSMLEYGSGIGNLTLPSASVVKNLIVLESDELALKALEKNLEMLNLYSSQNANQLEKDDRSNFREISRGEKKSNRIFSDATRKVKIQSTDEDEQILQDLLTIDTLLVNPPRSGLQTFLDLLVLNRPKKLKNIIYISCYPESFLADYLKIRSLGFQIHELIILDQFPQTRHFEIMALITPVRGE